MIAKTYILENLRQLDNSFKTSKKQKHMVYFSKLAILELCGWIEVTMDEIVLSHCLRHVDEQSNTKFFEGQIVKRNFGFDYEQHFRKMLINLIGIISWEKLEAKVPVAVHTKLKAELGTLVTVRNKLAHTYVKGPKGTMTIDAPSVTRARFKEIFNGLEAFEKELRFIKKT